MNFYFDHLPAICFPGYRDAIGISWHFIDYSWKETKPRSDGVTFLHQWEDATGTERGDKWLRNIVKKAMASCPTKHMLVCYRDRMVALMALQHDPGLSRWLWEDPKWLYDAISSYCIVK